MRYSLRPESYTRGTPLPAGCLGGVGLAPLVPPPPPNASPVIWARPASEPITDEASSGIMMIFVFGALASASSAFT